MTAEEKIDSRQKGPLVLCPWLVVLGGLLLYGITLNHWVTMSSLPVVARIMGWDWHPLPLAWRPSLVKPLFLILTLPARILPAVWKPVALNLFSAVCAALTLGVLAASVRLLPHDRTREQRLREAGEDSLLSVRAAFLPALFAVVMLGLQMTFWRDAVAVTGEMLDLLIFSLLILCLLKFRISQNDNWLAAFALIYGLGTTNNWALIGFFPFFLIALVWIKGVSFFNGRFLARMACWGVLGLLLYLVVPAVGSLTDTRADFLTLLRMELGVQSFSLRQVPRWLAAVAAVPTLLPLFFTGIRWPSFEGELSAAGNSLTRFMFRLLHVVFLALALVMFFNVKISPSLRLQESSVPFLTFYYMGALCIGYYSGYVLLVFGKAASQNWERGGSLAKAFNMGVVGLLWVLAVGATCKLLYQNLPHICADRKNVLASYSGELLRELPAKPIVVLADDAERLYMLQAACLREGKPNNNILIDTECLANRGYIEYLVARYPQLKKIITAPDRLRRVLPTDQLIKLVYILSRSYTVYYLQPSFGYYFEVFYLQPHGLVYEMQVYPKDALSAPPPTAQEFQENQADWARLKSTALAALPPLARTDPDNAWASLNYSVALDFWGVDLQRAGYLKEAGARFAEAVQINPQNFIAKINKEYNQRLQKNDHRPVDSQDLIYKAVNMYRGLTPVLKFNGPADEPQMNLEFGILMADGHDLRQASGLFQRRLDLLPGDPEAQLALAKTMVDLGQIVKALDLVRQLRANPKANKWEVSRVEALAYYAKGDYPSAENLMLKALREDPSDENRFAILAEFYRVTAYAALQQKKEAEATRRFKNALPYLDHELQILQSSGHKSTGLETVPQVLLKKAEIQMMLKSYQDSVTTLNQIMDLQPANATALLNRAIAETQLHQFQAAKSDYKDLRKLMPQQPFVIEYGLADIASLEKNSSEEIRRLKRYLRTAPDDTPEYDQIKKRVAKLESR